MFAPKAVVMEIEMPARGVTMVILSLEMAALMRVSSKVGSSVYLWAAALLTVAWRAVETAEGSEPSSATTEIPRAAMGVVTPAIWRMGSSVLAGPPKQRTTALTTRSAETEPKMREKNVTMAIRRAVMGAVNAAKWKMAGVALALKAKASVTCAGTENCRLSSSVTTVVQSVVTGAPKIAPLKWASCVTTRLPTYAPNYVATASAIMWRSATMGTQKTATAAQQVVAGKWATCALPLLVAAQTGAHW